MIEPNNEASAAKEIQARCIDIERIIINDDGDYPEIEYDNIFVEILNDDGTSRRLSPETSAHQIIIFPELYKDLQISVFNEISKDQKEKSPTG